MNSTHAAREFESPVADAGPRTATGRRWWTWATRLISAIIFAFVVWLIFDHARRIDWHSVWQTMLNLPREDLILAGCLSAASYLLYSSFDLIARYYLKHGISTSVVMGIGFVSYAFTLNIGSLVGGIVLRYRLYTRLGQDREAVARIISLAMLTNWIGYMPLAGAAFAFWPLDLPLSWKMSDAALRYTGFALLTASLIYLAIAFMAREKTWVFRGRSFSLPSIRISILQMVMSACNWSLMAAVIYVLLGQQIAFSSVLGVLLVGAMAGVLLHVPAGLGVLEAVFVALLSDVASPQKLLAAVLAYRAIYYLAGFFFGLIALSVIELRANKLRRAAIQPDLKD